jgi:trigger factor
VNAIVEQNSVKADEAAVRSKIEEIASSYEQPEQLINYYYSNEQQLNQVQSLVLEEQIVDLILEEAQVETETVSYEEALKPKEPEEAPESDEPPETMTSDENGLPEVDAEAAVDAPKE